MKNFKRNILTFLTIQFLVLFSTQVKAQNNCDLNNINCLDHNRSKVGNSSESTLSALTIIKAIPSPSAGTSGLAYDGSNLWVRSYPLKIFKISPEDGSILKTFNTSIPRPYGLTLVNGFLWVADNSLHKIYKLDTSNGNKVFSFNTNQSFNGDLTWDGNHLWHADADADNIYVYDTLGTKTGAHKINLNAPIGLTFANNYLWVGDNFTHKLYKTDPVSFNFLDTIVSPKKFPNGLAFDGQYLWVAENEIGFAFDSIYQISIAGNTGIIDKQNSLLDNVSIYPNPSNGVVNLTSDKNIDRIKIVDITGKPIYESACNENNFSLRLDRAGIYFIIIISGKKTISRKIMVYN